MKFMTKFQLTIESSNLLFEKETVRSGREFYRSPFLFGTHLYYDFLRILRKPHEEKNVGRAIGCLFIYLARLLKIPPISADIFFVKSTTLVLFIFICTSFEIQAGLVEPCAKWQKLPVKICKGNNELMKRYSESIAHEHRSVKGRRKFLKEVGDLDYVTSNNIFSEKDGLWTFSKNKISSEFTFDKTGISFEFIEPTDPSECDSILFFTSEKEYGGISNIGTKTGFKDRKNPKFKTNNKQKSPSFTIVEASDSLIEGAIDDHINRRFGTDYGGAQVRDANYEKYRKVVTPEVFNLVFSNFLLHEIGHLSGLRHSHAYPDVKKQDPEAIIEKKGKTAVDVCGFDQTSIMNYEYLDLIEKLGLELKNYSDSLIAPPNCLENPDLIKLGLSENDKKSLRCLYGMGKVTDNCPPVNCKH